MCTDKDQVPMLLVSVTVIKGGPKSNEYVIKLEKTSVIKKWIRTLLPYEQPLLDSVIMVRLTVYCSSCGKPVTETVTLTSTATVSIKTSGGMEAAGDWEKLKIGLAEAAIRQLEKELKRIGGNLWYLSPN